MTTTNDYYNAFGLDPATGTYANTSPTTSSPSVATGNNPASFADAWNAKNPVPPLATTTAPTLSTTPSTSNAYGASDADLAAFGIKPGTGNTSAPTYQSVYDSFNGGVSPISSNTPGTSQSFVNNLAGTVYSPNAPLAVTSPIYNSTLGDMYTKTFTDPNSMWDEYNQGQGVNFTTGAARAMAKAGRTGMLPALTSMAHQDYMSNYLPAVRKDLASGLGYENAWNQNLTNKYGSELGYSKGIYGTDVTKYGQELGYSSDMAKVAARVS